ncbi:MAG: spore maturation protein [Bacillales bacterium]|nr:spore maturation protein [Bacillales bacterium]
MEFLSLISTWMIPGIILITLIYAIMKKTLAYESFVIGGKEGIQIAVSIIPYLVGMMVAIGIFRASGLMDAFINLVAPLFQQLGIPKEVVPIALIRPISGNAALGMTNDLLKIYGPDSLIGMMASTVHASSDTTFYVLTVYFGAIGMKKMGNTIKIALFGDLVGIIAAILLVIFFWNK